MKAMNSLKLWVAVACLAGMLPAATMAQYLRTDLTSNQAGVAPNTNPALVNAWGLVQRGTSPFWISDNGTGFSTLYNGAGVQIPLVVTIPPAAGGTLGSPTGVVGNLSTVPADFTITDPVSGHSGKSAFIFATQDGTIAGWNPGLGPIDPKIGLSHVAFTWVDRSSVGAAYTGLAIAQDADGQFFLFAADDGPNRRIDRFDGSKNVVSFSDPEIPRNFTPYGIQAIDGKIWVTFTALNKAQGGFVDVFNTDGTLARHFAVTGPLHSPWGIALAPADFGPMSNAILISNNTSRGRVNAFDFNTGEFLGPLRDTSGNAIEIDNVWAIQFGHDGGQPKGGPQGTPHNSLFFTAGPNTYSNGLFGVITLGN